MRNQDRTSLPHLFHFLTGRVTPVRCHRNRLPDEFVGEIFHYCHLLHTQGLGSKFNKTLVLFANSQVPTVMLEQWEVSRHPQFPAQQQPTHSPRGGLEAKLSVSNSCDEVLPYRRRKEVHQLAKWEIEHILPTPVTTIILLLR